MHKFMQTLSVRDGSVCICEHLSVYFSVCIVWEIWTSTVSIYSKFLWAPWRAEGLVV